MARKEMAPSFAEQQAMAAQQELSQRADKEVAMLDINVEAEKRRKAMPQKIGTKEVMAAMQTLQKYKAGKSRLEKKIVANEQFWKLRQWSYYDNQDSKEFKPATAWLWKMIQSRYSDVMDSYPTCNFLPRQEDDKSEAKMLSSIIPIILEQNRYEETYSDIAWYMLKQGGCAQAIMWDGSKHNGLGDVSVKKIDLLNLFWEPGITNIQESENVFTVELVSNRILEQRYPQTRNRLGGEKVTVTKYVYDDNIDTSDKSLVVDWYYRTEVNGKKVLHYCKFVNDIVLYATENDTATPTMTDVDPQTGIPIIVPVGEPISVRGLYDHAMYPFVVQDLYPIEGSICGYGLTDIGRDTQMQIDILNKAVTDNAVVTSSPRYFSRMAGGINEEEFMDINKRIIHVEGNLDDALRPVEFNGLSATCVNELQAKIEELKFITSNQDVANGSAPAGITAGSAIAALQESAGKDARSTNQAFHRAFREVCYHIVELIRQFYDVPRQFRIVPDAMGEQFVSFSNQGLKGKPQTVNGADNGFRIPEFDIEVTSEKSSPYKKIEQNELALNFYAQGFFNPQLADQALACLNMMDFSRKDEIIQRIQQNSTLQQMLLQYQQLSLRLAQQVDPSLADQIANGILQTAGQPLPAGGEVAITDETNDEHPFVEQARSQARASTEVD